MRYRSTYSFFFRRAAPSHLFEARRESPGTPTFVLEKFTCGQNRVDQQRAKWISATFASRRVGSTGEWIFFSVTTSFRRFIYRSKCWEIRKLVNLLVRGNIRSRFEAFFSLADRRKYVRDPEMARRRER